MCEEILLRYNFETNLYSKAIQVPIDERCNSITVMNLGTTNIIFQGDIITPGNFKAIGGNRMEIISGRVDLFFQVPVPPPAVVTNLASVTQKYYSPNWPPFCTNKNL
jgi:hypothetical protein